MSNDTQVNSTLDLGTSQLSDLVPTPIPVEEDDQLIPPLKEGNSTPEDEKETDTSDPEENTDNSSEDKETEGEDSQETNTQAPTSPESPQDKENSPDTDETEKPIDNIDDAMPNIPYFPKKKEEENPLETETRHISQLEAIREVFCINSIDYTAKQRKTLYERFRAVLEEIYEPISIEIRDIVINKTFNVIHHWKNIEKSKFVIAKRPYLNSYKILLDHDWINQPLFFSKAQLAQYEHYVQEEAFTYNYEEPVNVTYQMKQSEMNWNYIREELKDILTEVTFCKIKDIHFKTFFNLFFRPMLDHFDLPPFGYNQMAKYFIELARIKPYQLGEINMHQHYVNILKTSENIEELIKIRNKVLDLPYGIVAEVITQEIQTRFLNLTGISFMDIENQYPRQKYQLPFI